MGRKRQVRHESLTIPMMVSVGYSVMGELRDELQDWYDNLPESFQNGSKGDELQEALDLMQEVDDEPDFPSEGIPEGWVAQAFDVVMPQGASWRSRRQRRDEASEYVAIAIQKVEELLEDASAEVVGIMEEYRDTLERAKDDWESVEFPRAFGG